MSAVVLVTGAEDPVGGRLVERLVLGGVAVRAAVRHPAHALRPCRFGIEVVAVPPEGPARLADAVAGCEVVFACDDDLAHPERMAPAAERLAEACARAGVRRLVVVSSAEVYEPLPADGTVDESSPRRRTGDPRHDALLEREDTLLAAGAPCVVLQPGIVYGPHTHWTDRWAERLRWTRPVVNADGAGTCNAVYVDDVVEAALAAARAPVRGERLLITGPPVSWRRFLDAHAAALGVAPPIYVGGPDGPGQAGHWQRPRFDPMTVAKAARARTRPLTKRAARLIGHQATVTIKRVLKQRLPVTRTHPDEREQALFASRCVLVADRARVALGWSPRYDFDAGMALTGAYLRWSQP
jgi:nucleoside-diphosphate-sugar epimerase